jgi:hypothetical protein
MFAFVLGCQAIWILTAEFFRPSAPDFPRSVQAAAAAATNRNAAALAASFGFIRGDIWAEYALTYSDVLWGEERASAQSTKVIEQAREVADRTLGFAPHDARIWLLLGSYDARFDWISRNSPIALRMSYYTGANETELIPLRLPLAVNSSAIADQDFRQLVSHDIRTIVTRKPELKPTILTAYQNATPTGQQFLKETLEEIDPTLLTALRPKE